MLCIHISSCDQIKFPQLVSVQLPGSECGSDLCLSLHQVKIPHQDLSSPGPFLSRTFPHQDLSFSLESCSSSRKKYSFSSQNSIILWLGFEHTKLFCRDKIFGPPFLSYHVKTFLLLPKLDQWVQLMWFETLSLSEYQY